MDRLVVEQLIIIIIIIILKIKTRLVDAVFGPKSYFQVYADI